MAFLGRVSDQLNCSSSQSFYIAQPSDSYDHTCYMWFHEQGIPHGCVSVRTCHRFSWEGLSEKTSTKHWFVLEDLSSYWGVLQSELACVSGILGRSFHGPCNLNHMVILKLLLLGIVNKLPNLKVSSSMVKEVYLT